MPQGDAGVTPPQAADAAAPRDGGTVLPPGAAPPREVAWPMPDWSEADPASVALDARALDEAAAHAESIGSYCLLVVRDGKLVYERYWNGVDRDTPNDSWSIAKSFTSALVGIALRRGEIESVDQPAADYLPMWVGTDKEAITIRHLLSMTSGLEFDFIADYGSTVWSRDMSADALALPLSHEPGTVWEYNNRAVQVLETLLQNATGMDVEAYAEMHLFRRLGMRLTPVREEGTHWNRDAAGNVTTFMNVRASCRDMARFGLLLLREGQWQDGPILERSFVDAATHHSQDLNHGYGWLIWTNDGMPAFDAGGDPFDGPILPAAPSDAFGAQGFGQNFIDVIPSENTVFIHMRNAPHDPPERIWTDIGGTIERLLDDARRNQHRDLNRILMDAFVPESP
jgi:CubicO group peptidase (beta-lactamase class C family)